MKALVAGWFSFEQMGATAGDLMARDVVCDWLREADVACDVALAPPFAGGVNWQTADPTIYSHVLFVCGPFGNGEPVGGFLERFAGKRLIGLDLTMLQSLDEWNPFDRLWERDSSRATRPDLAFLARQPSVPVVGTVLIHPQPEYGEDDRHRECNAAIEQLVNAKAIAAVPIDTRLDENATGLRSAAEVESLIARMDVVLTTRLHGMVLSLKNGVPPVVIDPVAGGAKIVRQARVLNWPHVFTPETVSPAALAAAFEECLSVPARQAAQRCAQRAAAVLEAVHREFVSAMATSPRM
ncbi:MAG: polysaccharide pyruvyl transferase family protein [Planctomycetes bacterium]|nr:polysaccharide pyruvyl transferase family protein [Planctomycetota bacterium]